MSSVAGMLRGNVQYLGGLAAGLVYVSKLVPHTWGLPYYQQFAQLYNNGFPVNPDQRTRELAQEVLDMMQLKEEDEARVNFFVAFGQEVVSKGSVHSNQGGIIGLPANFKYVTENDVERRKVTLNNHAVDWESEGGQKLNQSMVLSDQAKKFAIAREIFSIRSYRYQAEGGIAGACVLGCCISGFMLSRSFKLQEKTPRSFRAAFYTLVGLFGALTYVFVNDAYNCYQDRKLDRKTAELSPSLTHGGVEYYSKLLSRNIALRELMGPEGNRKYTAYGNEAQTWRTPHVPLTVCRDLLVTRLRETQSVDQPNADGM